MELDFSYAIDLLVEFLKPVFAFAGLFLVKSGMDWLKLDKDDKVRGYLQDAIVRAIDYGAEQARRRGQGLSDVRVRANVTNQAVSYLLEHVPDALQRFGITPESAAKMVEARLLSWMPEEEEGTRGVG